MIQTGNKINNRIESNEQQNVIGELRRNQQALELYDQYLSFDDPGKKFVLSKQIDWEFLLDKASRFPGQLDLNSLAASIIAHEQQAPHKPRLQPSVPFYASWFDYNSIHSIEKQGVPEYFGEKPSKTPVIYRKVRNLIMRLYWRNPEVRLTATACRRSVAGDACGVVRIHAFLETWGLINSQTESSALLGESSRAQSPTRVPSFQINHASTAVSHQSNSVRALESLTLDLFVVQKVDRPECVQCQQPVSVEWLERIKQQSPLVKSAEDPSNFESSAEKKDVETSSKPEVEQSCAICLCVKCFESGKLPVFLSREDFKSRSILTESHSSDSLKIVETVELIMSSTSQILTVGDLESKFPGLDKQAVMAVAVSAVRIASQSSEETSSILAKRDKPPSEAESISKNFNNMMSELRGTLNITREIRSQHSIGKRVRSSPSKVCEEISDVFARRTEKIALKLKFFEDFEKILYHEKQNLQVLDIN